MKPIFSYFTRCLILRQRMNAFLHGSLQKLKYKFESGAGSPGCLFNSHYSFSSLLTDSLFYSDVGISVCFLGPSCSKGMNLIWWVLFNVSQWIFRYSHISKSWLVRPKESLLGRFREVLSFLKKLHKFLLVYGE